MTPIYLGIDPGQSGAVAGLIGGKLIVFPFREDTERDTAENIKSLVTGNVQPYAVIESVHSFPKQGVASSFKFGQHYGFLRGLLIAYEVPFREVLPEKWQKAMECLSGGNKNVTKARAQQLFPSHRITHATADAILLALYCSRLAWKP